MNTNTNNNTNSCRNDDRLHTLMMHAKHDNTFVVGNIIDALAEGASVDDFLHLRGISLAEARKRTTPEYEVWLWVQSLENALRLLGGDTRCEEAYNKWFNVRPRTVLVTAEEYSKMANSTAAKYRKIAAGASRTATTRSPDQTCLRSHEQLRQSRAARRVMHDTSWIRPSETTSSSDPPATPPARVQKRVRAPPSIKETHKKAKRAQIKFIPASELLVRRKRKADHQTSAGKRHK